jgi:hypothetical protein
LKIFQGEHRDEIACNLCTKDDRTMITLGWDKKIVVWDLETGKPK